MAECNLDMASWVVRPSMETIRPTPMCTFGLFLNRSRGRRFVSGQTSSVPSTAIGSTPAFADLAISTNPRRILPRPCSSRSSGGTILPSIITPTGFPLARVAIPASIVERQSLPAGMHPVEVRNRLGSAESKNLSLTKIRGCSPRSLSMEKPTRTSKKLL